MSVKHANISIFVPHLGCPNMCSFCNQHHIARTEKIPSKADVDEAVEIATNSKNYNPSATEIAFFGGSFTAIDKNLMTELLSAAHKHVKSGAVAGIRISTRPDSIDDAVLSVLKNYGVSTIELGAQSMDDSVLAMNNRGHSADDVRKASWLIKEYGFNLGLQMMTGLYGSNDDLDVSTAEEIIKLKPDCVRIYPTITLEGTRLQELFESGKYTPADIASSAKLCAKINSLFEKENIPVIRLGLHTIDERAFVAGPWHPAFKELCDSVVFKEKIESMLGVKGRYIAYVNPKDLSKAKGQKKSNIEYFKAKGYELEIKADNSIEINDVLIKGCE